MMITIRVDAAGILAFLINSDITTLNLQGPGKLQAYRVEIVIGIQLNRTTIR